MMRGEGSSRAGSEDSGQRGDHALPQELKYRHQVNIDDYKVADSSFMDDDDCHLHPMS